jgi:transcriptional regulator with XRE-family HTH domain
MNVQHKSISSENASQIGGGLRMERVKRNLTLEGVSAKIGVHVGQLSRFERGQFIRLSKNLQKYAKYLQINPSVTVKDSLVERVMMIASKSIKHREAVEEIVTALERIG